VAQPANTANPASVRMALQTVACVGHFIETLQELNSLLNRKTRLATPALTMQLTELTAVLTAATAQVPLAARPVLASPVSNCDARAPAHDICQFSRSRRRCIDEVSDTFEICERVHVWSRALERIRDHDTQLVLERTQLLELLALLELPVW